MKNKILIIDDEKDIVQTLKMIFSFEGYDVIGVHSAIEGLNIIKKENISSVLLDIRMPGMDGITCLPKIKELKLEIPVIMISGVATIDDAIAAIKMGAFDLLEKPLDKNRILISIRNALSIEKLYKKIHPSRKNLQKNMK